MPVPTPRAAEKGRPPRVSASPPLTAFSKPPRKPRCTLSSGTPESAMEQMRERPRPQVRGESVTYGQRLGIWCWVRVPTLGRSREAPRRAGRRGQAVLPLPEGTAAGHAAPLGHAPIGADSQTQPEAQGRLGSRGLRTGGLMAESGGLGTPPEHARWRTCCFYPVRLKPSRCPRGTAHDSGSCAFGGRLGTR